MNIQRFVSQSPSFSIIQANLSIQNSLGKMIDGKISFLQAMILAAIFFEKDRYALPSPLAQALGVSKSSISHAISELESQKLVKRSLAPQDARKTHVLLTGRGAKMAIMLVKHFDAVQKQIEKKLGDAGTLKVIQQIKAIEESHR